MSKGGLRAPPPGGPCTAAPLSPRAACVGVFQAVLMGQESKDSLRDVLVMLRNTSNPQVEYITRIIQRHMATVGGL